MIGAWRSAIAARMRTMWTSVWFRRTATLYVATGDNVWGKACEFLFTGRLSPQYARLVCKIGVHFAGHLNVRPGTGAIASGRL
jgi:hypothetical protein